MCVNMSTYMGIGMCTYMCTDMSIDMCIDMCMDVRGLRTSASPSTASTRACTTTHISKCYLFTLQNFREFVDGFDTSKLVTRSLHKPVQVS